MHEKVIAIKNEIKNDTIKIKYAQQALDAIAQYALQHNDYDIKVLADKAFAMLPMYKERANELNVALDQLESALISKGW